MAFHVHHKAGPDIFYRSSKTIHDQKDFDLEEKKEQPDSDQPEKKKEHDR